MESTACTLHIGIDMLDTRDRALHINVMSGADQYLYTILNREAVDSSISSPLRQVATTLMPRFQAWAGNLLVGVHPSGSFAKGTANASGTDIDLFLSLRRETTGTLKGVYDTLFVQMTQGGYAPKKQNVSIGVRVGRYDVDLVPAKLQNPYTTDHSLWRNRAQTWTKTNIHTHIAFVQQSGRQQEIRLLKLWRNQRNLDFPSFCLELSVITALAGNRQTLLSDRVWSALTYLSASFQAARVVDPANTNNIVSDDLTVAEKQVVARSAAATLAAKNWNEVIR